MKKSLFLLLSLVIICVSCKTQMIKTNAVFKSDTLKIEQISEHVFVHISYLETDDFGKVACNGMIVMNQSEVIIYDTPASNAASEQLISWIKNEMNWRPTAVVVTHFHADCLAGLETFHAAGIPSFASDLTIGWTIVNEKLSPQHSTGNYYEHKLGDKKVISQFFGAGHTTDNIIGYFPAEEVLFGGCLIKELNASKGYLGDANVAKWSQTVGAIKKKYPTTKIVVPGHGSIGDITLLDYTINLFEPESNNSK